MNGIMGMTELLLNTPLTEKQREYAETIWQSADALQTLINDILDFSKIEAGKLTLAPLVFNLEEAVLEIARLLAITADSKGFKLRVQYPPQMPHYFVGDAGRIRQILINLAGNAIKFTRQGYILIEVILVETLDQIARIQFRIEDTGIGIAPDKLNTIFDKFTQADTSITRQFGGTGLGLAISSQLVKMMGGVIAVQSEVGKGSTFVVTVPLPLATPPKDIEETLSQLRGPGTELFQETQLLEARQTRRFNFPVLLVEDNDISRLVAVNMLEQFGCQITEARNGQEALELLQSSSYAIVFMDVQMPELDGFEATRLIREREGDQSHTIIVAMTANAMRGDAEYCMAKGMDDYIAKPISLERIFDILVKYSLPSGKDSVTPIDTIVASDRTCLASNEAISTIYQEMNKRILLVEDNPVNRLVALNMLKKLNCIVEVAENGKDAVEVCSRTRYDLILMDIQMPIMDGTDATKLILQDGSYNGQTPVVAVTANIRPADVKRYLAAGMKECVGKPLTVERLRAVVEKYVRPSKEKLGGGLTEREEQTFISANNEVSVSSSSQPATNKDELRTNQHHQPAELTMFDFGQARRISIGNIHILRKVINKFAQDTPQQLEKLQNAWETGDQDSAERLAHSLKGSARSVGALRLGEVAFKMETSARQGDLAPLEQLIKMLKEEFIQLQTLWENTDWDRLL
jgi:CheY-like chemotaxis protein/HPt (histidine-containing phosphotransfer) domain-containing protein